MTKKIVLVTGGSRGIGAAVALGAAKQGYAVAISFQSNETAANDVIAKAKEHGSDAIAIKADTSSEQDTIALFETVDKQLGRVDAVVINAGIAAPALPFADYSAERIKQVLDTNVFGAFITAREAVRRMSTERGGNGGSIVNVSSAAARLGSANEYIDYAASKGAMDTMTLGLGVELGDQGVRVNAVRPGMIATDIHATNGRPNRVEDRKHGIPMQRGGTAQEVADTVLWLMSDQASYVTSALIDVSGGR
jgi:NAD(P)-dependent dehydrogenase (short-subunit alcohol dehydrogenase family)